MSTLYIVATPIGNLKDVTLRALEVLKSVDVIACEDTRHSMKFLTAHGIQKRLISCRSHNEEDSARGIIQLLEQGQHVAYVSDAGTPGISDPGTVLVKAVRAAGIPVVPVPGVSALTALASVAGAQGRTLVFDGFLSTKPGKRRKRLKELLDRNENAIVYESPHRIVKLLEDIADIDPQRPVCVGRELTKLHEEFTQGSCADVLNDYRTRKAVKGELAVFIYSV
ncbi:MAG: 16S rRNA (cytidine(1402)-2'-O)-methyltransferase [Spirochaetales bacterium]|nr:16S rRNA (cytidine(1402)-2'-O)-methyltransferase [Spirochaetales bacterium]